MGRHTTGSLTTNEVYRIELSYLLKRKFIQKGRTIEFILRWNNGSKISVVSCYIADEIWLKLHYTVTDYEGKKHDYDYKIHLTENPSNLGIGNVLYFICPNSGNLCRILYKCYGSHIWKSRKAYKYRIYYPCQVSSKLSYFNDRYWQIDKKLENLKIKRRNYYYKNNKTKRLKRIERLIQSQARFDNLRWTIGLPQWLRANLNDIYR